MITLLSVYNVSCKDNIDPMVVSPSMLTLLWTVKVSAKVVILPTDKESLIITLLFV